MTLLSARLGFPTPKSSTHSDGDPVTQYLDLYLLPEINKI